MKIKSLVIITVIAGLAGCTTVQKGLVGEKHENLAPFADTTVEFLGSSTVDFRENELVYLRQYYDAETREISRLKDLLRRVDNFRDEVVYYSVELVRISEENQTDAEKCIDLADTLSGRFRESYLRQTDMSPDEFDATVAQIRQQQNFLSALQILQPAIVKSGEYFESIVREVEDEALPDARNLLDASIEEEYATLRRQLDIIYDRRDELMTGLQMIRAFRTGDDDALDGLNEATILPNRSYALPNSPSDAQLDRTKSYIVQQLQEEEVILGLLERDVADYIATRAELEAEEAEILDGLALARRQIVAWIRTHQQLADGVRDPGKWFAAVMKVAEGFRKVK